MKSNNWQKYKPEIILVEEGNIDFNHPFDSEIYKFLIDKNYSLFAKTYNTLIFKLNT